MNFQDDIILLPNDSFEDHCELVFDFFFKKKRYWQLSLPSTSWRIPEILANF